MDCWSADVVMWPFPAKVEEDSELAEALTDAGADLYAISNLLRGRNVEKIDGDKVVFSGEQEYRLRRDGDKGRVLHFCDFQASCGVAQFTDSCLRDVLRSLDVAYVISDEGSQGYHGEEFSWRPGLSNERHRQRLPDGTTALGAAAFAELAACASTKHGVDSAKLGELVVAHFGYDPYDWWPGKPEPDAVELGQVEVRPEARARPSALAV